MRATPDIHEYLDYRRYLGDAFEALRSRNPRISARGFAIMAGMSPPNLLQMVVSGQRRLPESVIGSAAKALGLDEAGAEFFRDLVRFSHARGHVERDEVWKRLLRRARFRAAQPLAVEQYECFRHWYVPVVRELASHPQCTGAANWIASRIRPKVTTAQVEKALEVLEELQLLRREGGRGRWTQTEIVVKTPVEVESLAVAEYHRAVLSLASDAIESVPAAERDIRSATVGVSKATAKILKERLTALWSEILEQAGRESVPEVVLQINTQMFPLTKDQEAES